MQCPVTTYPPFPLHAVFSPLGYNLQAVSFTRALASPFRHHYADQCQLEMWANAQPDGRPAEYRWRPLFNAAKFG